MIVTEIITRNGKQFTQTYSNKGFMIERDGAQYSEAIDPIYSGRIYAETDIPIESDVSESDYIEALRELGVKIDEQT